MKTSRNEGSSRWAIAAPRIAVSGSSQFQSPPFQRTIWSEFPICGKRARMPAPTTDWGRRVGKARGNHRDHRGEAGVAIVGSRIDQSFGQHRPQPEVTLALAGADEVMADPKRVDKPIDGEAADEVAYEWPRAGEELERLERIGGIEIEDEPGA